MALAAAAAPMKKRRVEVDSLLIEGELIRKTALERFPL